MESLQAQFSELSCIGTKFGTFSIFVWDQDNLEGSFGCHNVCEESRQTELQE